jgi:hypothetical protein
MSFMYKVIKVTLEHHTYTKAPYPNYTTTRIWYIDDNDKEIKTITTEENPLIKIEQALPQHKTAYQSGADGGTLILNVDEPIIETKYITH